MANAETKIEDTNLAHQDATAPLLSRIASLESALMIAKTDWSSQEIMLIQRCQAVEKDRNDVWTKHEGLVLQVRNLENDLENEKTLRLKESDVAIREKQKENIVCT